MVANSKVDTLNQLCRQLEQSRDEALEGQQKLRVDLKGLQQNLSGAFSMDGGTSQQKKSATGEAKSKSLTEAKQGIIFDKYVEKLMKKVDVTISWSRIINRNLKYHMYIPISSFLSFLIILYCNYRGRRRGRY
jgi:hypothetical protein